MINHQALDAFFVRRKHGGDLEAVAAVLKCAPTAIYDFSSNVLGTLAAPVLEAVEESLTRLSLYPSPEAGDCLLALEAATGLQAEELVLGNGAADLIVRVAMALRLQAKEGQRIALPVPNFSAYARAFKAVGFAIDQIFLEASEGYQVGPSILERLSTEHAALLLCQPNNPSGSVIEPELLRQIEARCEALEIPLLMDACFLDFLPKEKRKDLNLAYHKGAERISLYSMTKRFAMPGLRVGYLHCQCPKLKASLDALTPPWQLSTPARAALLAALALPEAGFEQALWALGRERERLREVLQACGATEISGEANYLFFRSEKADLHLRLLSRPPFCLIRPCAKEAGLGPGYFRVAVKSREENDILMQRLQEERSV